MLKANIHKISLKLNDDYFELIQDVEFKVLPSKVYTVLGQNGSGKSVLIKSLTGLLNENDFRIEGEVLFDENNLLKLKTAELKRIRREKIKYVFQDSPNSFDPLKKLRYYFTSINRYNSDEIESTFEKLLLPIPKLVLEKHPYELSFGQLQRISFALELLAEPDIIILDEPTASIDVINSSIFRKILSEFVSNDKTVLSVTHDLKFALKSSDYIAFLHNKKLSTFYSTDEVEAGNIETEMKEFIKTYKRVLV